MTLLLVSLAVYMGLQNAISLIFGDGAHSLQTWPIRKGVALAGVLLTHVQLLIVGATILVYSAGYFLLRLSSLGLAYRAVSCDFELARLSGIRVNRIVGASPRSPIRQSEQRY